MSSLQHFERSKEIVGFKSNHLTKLNISKIFITHTKNIPVSNLYLINSAKRMNSLRGFILRKLIQKFHTPVRAEIRMYPGRYIAASYLRINSKSTFNLFKD